MTKNRLQRLAVQTLFPYYSTMYRVEKLKRPSSSSQELDSAARYQVTLLLLMPVMGLVMLLTLVLMKSGWFPFPGMGWSSSKYALALAVGVTAIISISLFVRRLGLGSNAEELDSDLPVMGRERLRATLVFWLAFALSLGIPGAIVVVST